MPTPTTQLHPEIVDASNVGARLSEPLFLPIGVEGQKDAGGTSAILITQKVTRPADADTLFGAASPLAGIVKFLLERGVNPVYAIASKSALLPTLAERQLAWDELSTNPYVRIRLTDSTVQADLVALGTSCVQAEGVQNKQFCVVGMPTTTSKAALITAAAAIASKRAVLVAPGIYDENGTLKSGAYTAAAVAAELAKNSDLTDDLDTALVPKLTDIEHDANGNALFRQKITGGVAVNDFEELLVAGVSPVRQARDGGVEIDHLRMTYVTDSSFDSVTNRLVVDQVFLELRSYLNGLSALRMANDADTRDRIKSGVEAKLAEMENWISPVAQSDGSLGYNVEVVSSLDQRQLTVNYSGQIIRGISTIQVSGILITPA